jgi:hypothetical protein
MEKVTNEEEEISLSFKQDLSYTGIITFPN